MLSYKRLRHEYHELKISITIEVQLSSPLKGVANVIRNSIEQPGSALQDKAESGTLLSSRINSIRCHLHIDVSHD